MKTSLYALMIVAVSFYCALSTEPTDENDDIFKRDRYLLLDSRIIESTENMELTVGVAIKNENNPLFTEDKPWEPRFDNPYCSVIYDEEEKIYKCWYSRVPR